MSLVLSPIKQKFINTIVAYVTNTNIKETINTEELKSILKFAKYHSIENIVYNGLKNSHNEIPEGYKKYINTLFQKAIIQDSELATISKQFNENQIYHLPLKGSVIRNYYPTLDARNMCDLDILVKIEDFEKVKQILLSLGYQISSTGGNHDVYLKPPFMELEIHRKMIAESVETSSYYDNIYERVIKSETNYRLNLQPEDLYIFNIIHAGKHFAVGGTGLRILTDIYYLKKAYPALDFNYINNELKKTKLDTLAMLLLNISTKLFSQTPLLEEETLVLDYLIDSGSYGTLEQSLTKDLIEQKQDSSKKGKYKLMLRKIFPPLSHFKQMYPILNKHPYLVPIYFFKRLFKVIFNKEKRQSYLNNINNIDEEKLNKLKTIRDITKLDN